MSQANEYYENEVDGLGRAFIHTLHGAVQEIKSFPELSREIKKPYRRFLLPRFPFGVIYRIKNDTIYIVAVSHLKRKPYYWLKREPKD